jgi:hypothetical protein
VSENEVFDFEKAERQCAHAYYYLIKGLDQVWAHFQLFEIRDCQLMELVCLELSSLLI